LIFWYGTGLNRGVSRARISRIVAKGRMSKTAEEIVAERQAYGVFGTSVPVVTRGGDRYQKTP